MTEKQSQEMLDWMASREQIRTINLKSVEIQLRVMSFSKLMSELEKQDLESQTNSSQSNARQSKNRKRLWRAKRQKGLASVRELKELVNLVSKWDDNMGLGDKFDIVVDMLAKVRKFLEVILPIVLISPTWLAKSEALNRLTDLELIDLFRACFETSTSSQN